MQQRFSLILVVFLLGCGSLPVTQAVWTSTPETVPEAAWTRDETSNLQWLAGNDDEAFFLQVIVPDRMRQILMRRAGLKVYLDPSGSKSEDIQVHYPFVAEPPSFNPREDRMETPTIISTDMLWIRGDDQTVLNPHLEKTGFKADMTTNLDGILTFSLRVPLDSLREEGGPLPTEVAVGLEWFRPERPGEGMDMRAGGERDGMRPEGGRSGGVRGVRRPGGPAGEGERPNRDNLTGPVWFMAKLAVKL